MSFVLRMDVLLAGNVILPMEGHFAGHDVQRRLLVENVPGKSNIIPGRPRKCSASARNRVHLHPGIVFIFARIPQSAQ